MHIIVSTFLLSFVVELAWSFWSRGTETGIRHNTNDVGSSWFCGLSGNSGLRCNVEARCRCASLLVRMVEVCVVGRFIQLLKTIVRREQHRTATLLPTTIQHTDAHADEIRNHNTLSHNSGTQFIQAGCEARTYRPPSTLALLSAGRHSAYCSLSITLSELSHRQVEADLVRCQLLRLDVECRGHTEKYARVGQSVLDVSVHVT